MRLQMREEGHKTDEATEVDPNPTSSDARCLHNSKLAEAVLTEAESSHMRVMRRNSPKSLTQSTAQTSRWGHSSTTTSSSWTSLASRRLSTTEGANNIKSLAAKRQEVPARRQQPLRKRVSR